jgi:hypothetical protein
VSTRDGTIIGTKRERACVARTKIELAWQLLDEVARELPFVLPSGHHATQAAEYALLAAKRAHAVLEQTLKRIPA